MLTDDTAPSCTVTGGSSSKDGRGQNRKQRGTAWGAKGKAKRHCPERSARCIMLTDDTAPSCTVTGGSSSKDGRGAKGKAKRHCPERSARCIMLTDDTAPSCTVTGGSSSKDGRGAKGKAKRHCMGGKRESKEALPRVELGLVDSESTVITTTLQRRHVCKCAPNLAYMNGQNELIFCSSSTEGTRQEQLSSWSLGCPLVAQEKCPDPSLSRQPPCSFGRSVQISRSGRETSHSLGAAASDQSSTALFGVSSHTFLAHPENMRGLRPHHIFKGSGTAPKQTARQYVLLRADEAFVLKCFEES